jgi:hypothetical protein
LEEELMEEGGMKKNNREAIKVEPKVKVSLRVLPFGSIIYITAPTVPPMKEQLPDMPRYTEPLTTNIEKIEIRYGEGETYSVPRTTACM